MNIKLPIFCDPLESIIFLFLGRWKMGGNKMWENFLFSIFDKEENQVER